MTRWGSLVRFQYLPPFFIPLSCIMKKGLFWLFGIYLCVLFGAAIVAGLAFDGIQVLAQKTTINWIQYLSHKPLSQYVDRLRLVGFFFIAIPFICKHSKITKRHLDIRFNGTTYLITFCRGCFLWCVLFGIIACLQKNITITNIHVSLVSIFIASLLLAIMEEVIFRGICFEVLRKKHSLKHNITLLGLLFASLHFAGCNEIMSDHHSIVRAMQCALSSITDITKNIQWPYFCCLFLFNGILVRFRLIYRSLWASIGFHQGLVFTLMLIRKRCSFGPLSNEFWGTGRLTDAWFVVIVLIVINLLMRRYLSSNEKAI